MKYEEDGSTLRSVENAKKILVDLGVPDTIRLWHDPEKWYLVEAEWEKPKRKHLFEGFSWSYAGTGSQGLVTFLNAVGMPLELKDVARWPALFGADKVQRSGKGPLEWSPRSGAATKVLLKNVDYGKDWV